MNKITPVLIGLMFFISVLPNIPIGETATTTITRSYTQSRLGIDLGTVTYTFSTTLIQWCDNWIPQNCFSFETPKISGISIPIISISQNSTTIIYVMSVGFLGRTFTGNIYLTQQLYNYKITIKGSITGSTTSLPLTLVMNGGTALSYDGITKQVSIKHLAFNWADASQPTSFNNSTKTLTITIGNSFTIDPLAIDTFDSCAGTLILSCSLGLNTANNNDIIIIFEIAEADLISSCNAPTDNLGTHLTYTKKKEVDGTYGIYCFWWAIWTSHGAITITCNWGGFAGYGDCIAFAISGASTTANGGFFDTSTTAECNNTINTGTSISCTSKTDNANDIIIGLLGCDENTSINPCPSAPTVGTGFTSIKNQVDSLNCAVNFCIGAYTESDIVSSTQSALSVSYSGLTSGQEYVIIGEAICASTTCAPIYTLSETIALSPTISLLRLTNTLSKTISDSSSIIVALTNKLSKTISDSASISLDLSNTISKTISNNPSIALSLTNIISKTLTDNPSLSLSLTNTLSNSLSNIITLGQEMELTISALITSTSSLNQNLTLTLDNSISLLSTLSIGIAHQIEDFFLNTNITPSLNQDLTLTISTTITTIASILVSIIRNIINEIQESDYVTQILYGSMIVFIAIIIYSLGYVKRFRNP